jgi:transposase
MGVAIGVDSHKSSLAAATLDELGRVVGVREFPNDERGHDAVLRWSKGQGHDRIIGIEGTGSFGVGLARHLLDAGEEVYEVPAFLSYRERKRNPSKGKSDPSDAVAIARVVARREGLSSPQRADVFVDLKLLSDHRDQLVRARTRLINRTHTDLVISHPGYEKKISKLNTKKNQSGALALLRGDRSVQADLIRDRIADIRRLTAKIATTEKEIAGKVTESATNLTALQSISFVLAAKILGEVGDPSRIRSKGAFAMLTGTAPLEASSGTTKRHRLNRGGNRQLNYALHMVARARLRHDADPKAYVARRQLEGKSDKEAMRCLKRHLSNVVFRRLVIDLKGLREAA